MEKLAFLSVTTLMILLVAPSCKTTTYSSDNLPEKQLYFGSGGGFTGLVTEYLLLENGQLFKHPSSDVYEALKRVKKKKAEAAYSNYYETGFDDLLFNQPGNIYYFIRMVDGENENYISWSDQRPLPKKEMMAFYKTLIEMINN